MSHLLAATPRVPIETDALSSRLSMLTLLAVGLQMHASAADHDRGALVGTWHLVRYVDTPEGGTSIQPFRNLTGRPVYIHRRRACRNQHHAQSARDHGGGDRPGS